MKKGIMFNIPVSCLHLCIIVFVGAILLYLSTISTRSELSTSSIFSPDSHDPDVSKEDLLIPLKSSASSWLSSNVTIMDPYEIEKFDQKDLELLNYIKARHLTPPSKLPYNFNGPYSKFPGGDPLIAEQVIKIFNKKKGGFFVECGGYDGIYSESVFLERDYDWSGLLIECNPILVPEIIKVHRKSYLADVCLSVTNHPKMTEITSATNWPAASSTLNGSNIFPTLVKNFTRFEVQSIPFYSLIAATGVKEVDLIVLDVQGVELKILKTFPFDAILVKVWVVEIVLLSKEDIEEIEVIMTRNEYKEGKPLGDTKYDYLYVHNSV